MDFVLFEHSSHGLVTSNLSFVVGVLEVFGPDVGPYSFDGLRAGQLMQLAELLRQVQGAPYCGLAIQERR